MTSVPSTHSHHGVSRSGCAASDSIRMRGTYADAASSTATARPNWARRREGCSGCALPAPCGPRAARHPMPLPRLVFRQRRGTQATDRGRATACQSAHCPGMRRFRPRRRPLVPHPHLSPASECDERPVCDVRDVRHVVARSTLRRPIEPGMQRESSRRGLHVSDTRRSDPPRIRQRQPRGRAPGGPRRDRRGERGPRARVRRRRLHRAGPRGASRSTSARTRRSPSPSTAPAPTSSSLATALPPVGSGRSAPRISSHQHRRMRRARAHRQREARARRDPGRQADARACATRISPASASSTTCSRASSRSRTSRELGGVYTPDELRGARRPRPRARACSCTSTARGSATPRLAAACPCGALAVGCGRRRALLWRHQERHARRRGGRAVRRRAIGRSAVRAQAERAALVEDAIRRRRSSSRCSRATCGIECASHANAMAARLAGGGAGGGHRDHASRRRQRGLRHPAAARSRRRLQERFRFYVWDEARNEVRWVTSWDTAEEDVDALVAALADGGARSGQRGSAFAARGVPGCPTAP